MDGGFCTEVPTVYPWMPEIGFYPVPGLHFFTSLLVRVPLGRHTVHTGTREHRFP
jgi:hypothetical protein